MRRIEPDVQTSVGQEAYVRRNRPLAVTEADAVDATVTVVTAEEVPAVTATKAPAANLGKANSLHRTELIHDLVSQLFHL